MAYRDLDHGEAERPDVGGDGVGFGFASGFAFDAFGLERGTKVVSGVERRGERERHTAM